MLNITYYSKMCVKTDQYSDYIPLIGSATNVIDLFLKCVVRPCVGEARLEHNHYFAYLNTKTWLRCAMLAIPAAMWALGKTTWLRPIAVAMPVLFGGIDVFCAVKAEEAEGLAKSLSRPNEAGHAVRCYNEASWYGSVEAKFQLGECAFWGRGITKADSAMAKPFYRAAAALGHEEANEALGFYDKK